MQYPVIPPAPAPASPSPSGSRCIRLLLEYDGGPYAGWQQQAGQATVQGTLAEALGQVLRQPPPPLSCAGRTDAGVHATGQCVSFVWDYPHPSRRLAPALNHHLPPSIRVHRAEDAPAGFDARFSARGKHYTYTLYEGPQRPALEAGRVWHLRRHLSLDAMRAAAAALVGEHDFESFRSSHCDAPHAVRRVTAIEVEAAARPPVGRTVRIHFHANAFCRHMCRILAGTLAEVGWGGRPVAAVASALAGRRRALAGVTAPAAGLTLIQVRY